MYIQLSITGNEEYDYSIEPVRNNSTQADFTLYKDNFMDIIVTAKVDFSVAERNGSRVVSREFSLEGDNQVPIMIVNEDDRRIQNIPMINPHNLEGVGIEEICLKTILFLLFATHNKLILVSDFLYKYSF